MPTATLARLKALRALFAQAQTLSGKKVEISAFLVPSADQHQSEYIADCDKRRAYISGFTGSAGDAIVTSTKAALFTDGRYFLQAENQLDENWTLVRSGTPGAPSQQDWLIKNIPPNSAVGVDPFLTSVGHYRSLQAALQKAGHSLVTLAHNLVDEVWNRDGRPSSPKGEIFPLPVEFSGLPSTEKIAQVRAALSSRQCSGVLLCGLDEVAWLFNLRGSDVSYNPVFFSYALVTHLDAVLFVDRERLSPDALAGLDRLVVVKPYSSILEELRARVPQLQALSDTFWVGPQCNQAIAEALSPLQLLEEMTPVCTLKAVKNAAELQGMRNCHVRDGAALCEFFAHLETLAAKHQPVLPLTECSAATLLEGMRTKKEHFVSLSFETIAGMGPHGAIIHYKPDPAHEAVLRTDQLFLCDSGAQYKDGTTDVTRTIHLGTPTPHEKRMFTLVLKGHIGLASAVFPEGVGGNLLDILARMPLYKAGLDYRHGTGHGVGSFLNVHEGPHGISKRASAAHPLVPGMIVTNEPGYYADGEFGIRIENVMEVVDVKTEFNFGGMQFLGLRSMTMAPYQRKLIDVDLLSREEIAWINEYHSKCRTALAPHFHALGRGDLVEWLEQATAPIA